MDYIRPVDRVALVATSIATFHRQRCPSVLTADMVKTVTSTAPLQARWNLEHTRRQCLLKDWLRNRIHSKKSFVPSPCRCRITNVIPCVSHHDTCYPFLPSSPDSSQRFPAGEVIMKEKTLLDPFLLEPVWMSSLFPRVTQSECARKAQMRLKHLTKKYHQTHISTPSPPTLLDAFALNLFAFLMFICGLFCPSMTAHYTT